MNKFPDGIQFKYPWREYQARVLEELDSHLDDNHLSIVAAPGSGKTVLGLEVMLRINKPTLILAPTLAIRNQWVERFTELFLQTDSVPEWISTDPKSPAFITVATYQGLHSLVTHSDTEAEEEDTDTEFIEDSEITIKTEDDTFALFKKMGLQTIVIDEAHHLRNSWWQSLELLKKHIEKPHIVSLTATPPYDVLPKEWARYQSMSGPIDADISVPELIMRDDLCPHQDYVYFNTLTERESLFVSKYRDGIKDFLVRLDKDSDFISSLLTHPLVQDPQSDMVTVLDNPAYFSSIAIFLKHSDCKIPRRLLHALHTSTNKLPKFDLDWATTLLQNYLHHDKHIVEFHGELVQRISKELKQYAALEKRVVQLKSNKETRKLLKQSINKLRSVSQIAQTESASLGNDLRMVVLTDFIRKEYLPSENSTPKLNQIGVVPIFEELRRSDIKDQRIGILCGTLVVVPKTALTTLQETCNELSIPLSEIDTHVLPGLPDHLRVQLSAKYSDDIVRLITEVFNKGEITIIVGTKSLLGEGWDAPSINTLVLASFVGSFMLSNQMRGRAIRIDPEQPNKVANIWHLASVDLKPHHPGYDFRTLTRRFKAFVGVSYTEDYIESGFQRIGMGMPPYSNKQITNKNIDTITRSRDRKTVAGRWIDILNHGEVKEIIPEVSADKHNLPRPFVFMNTLYALLWRSISLGVGIFFLLISTAPQSGDFEMFLIMAGFGILAGLIISLPKLIKILWLFIKNGPVSSNMKQVGNALLKSLCKADVIHTDVNRIRIVIDKFKGGEIYCGIEGGTVYEKSVFLDAMQEILNPIENPRYILMRKSKWNIFLRHDFHTVPSVLASHKEKAEYFSKMWAKYVGDNELLYTRNLNGRGILLHARQHAMANQLRKVSDRLERWK